MEEINSNYRVEELTGDELAELLFEMEHHNLPSCQSDESSGGDSDLSAEEGE